MIRPCFVSAPVGLRRRHCHQTASAFPVPGQARGNIGYSWQLCVGLCGLCGWQVWGANQAGQLAVGDYADRLAPTLVETLAKERLVDMCAGAHHSLFVTQAGAVYAAGSNRHGQLGVGAALPRTCVPILIDSISTPSASATPRRASGAGGQSPTSSSSSSSSASASASASASGFSTASDLALLSAEARAVRIQAGPRRPETAKDRERAQAAKERAAARRANAAPAAPVAPTEDASDSVPPVMTTDAGADAGAGAGQSGRRDEQKLQSARTPVPVPVAPPSPTVSVARLGGGSDVGRGRVADEGLLPAPSAANSCMNDAVVAAAADHDSADAGAAAAIDRPAARILKVAAGALHSALLSLHGEVFVFGANRYGQLGLGDRRDRAEPRRLRFMTHTAQTRPERKPRQPAPAPAPAPLRIPVAARSSSTTLAAETPPNTTSPVPDHPVAAVVVPVADLALVGADVGGGSCSQVDQAPSAFDAVGVPSPSERSDGGSSNVSGTGNNSDTGPLPRCTDSDVGAAVDNVTEILTLTPMPPICQIACGAWHTLLLTGIIDFAPELLPVDREMAARGLELQPVTNASASASATISHMHSRVLAPSSSRAIARTQSSTSTQDQA
jgi:hypothetical protein